MQKYNVVDLFSGAGGLSLGFLQTGRVQVVAAAENNVNARKTYKRNHKVQRLYSDVRTIDYSELLDAVGSVDIVIGGPPCQGFSNANRQHTTVISMNNRLVKEYVRAVCALRPKAFVMENVAMLRSQIHRFMVEEDEIDTPILEKVDLSTDEVEILPASSVFEGALDFITNLPKNTTLAWADPFYRVINLLYRYRINQPKFDASMAKYKKQLEKQLHEIIDFVADDTESTFVHSLDVKMAKSILGYMEKSASDFQNVIHDIERPLFMQKAIAKIREITDNNVHVYEYKESKGSIVAVVKSYAVLDYITCVLGSEPYCYKLKAQVLNALQYGAPQKRERFIIVGMDQSVEQEYLAPAPECSEPYFTVRHAIEDIKDVPASTEVNAKPVELPYLEDLNPLVKKLRGRLLYNHITTATKDTAMARFKALKEGQNFHDLDATLKTTYSNADRTQNTIYMRLKYDEPSGTVVNVRKSMWIHPELDRAISIREAARLQTFPDSFVFEGPKDSQYQQIGNAVPPFLANAIARSVIAVLDDNQ